MTPPTHRFYFKTANTADAAADELREKCRCKVRIKVSRDRGAFEVLATPTDHFPRTWFTVIADRHSGEYAGPV